ncbi:MAG: TRAP transporter small permease [Gracilibacteraceae bacterium]|jgi:C4-dicarboxylate transporter DctQ subunit|nr:TRAP transporter small permease [Gracilibacteraceae bacterium]
MKYPKTWEKTVNALAVVSGCMVMLIAFLALFEAVARHLFRSPTSWSLNTSGYMLIWLLFLGTSYAFQEHGHVAVDMLRDVADKLDGTRRLRRAMAVVGYLISTIFVTVLGYGGVKLTQSAAAMNMKTTTTTPIPLWPLYAAIIAGCALMLVTLIFILLDLSGKGEKYL